MATGEWLESTGRPHFPSALVLAIDERSEPRNPAFGFAEERLLDKWPTLRNAFSESPNELFRAIVLQGVDIAVAADPDLSAAAWYITRTVREMSISAGRWARVVDDVIGDIDRAVRERLVRDWAPTIAESDLALPKRAVDDADLPEVVSTEQLHAALEPYRSDLSGYYQQVSGALGENVPPILDALGAAVDAVRTGLALVAKQASLVQASRLRETLLWWRLAGRSELLGKRYKQVEDPATRALAAACDLHRLCPALTPEVVEHLLADVVSDAGPPDVPLPFDGLVEAWMELSGILDLGHGTGPLIGALNLGEQGVLPPAMVRDLSSVEVAVVAFRDLQTTRLTSLVSDVEASS